jgi:hypothetical protein
MTALSHASRTQALQSAFSSVQNVTDLLGDVDVPSSIAAWLGRLHALTGVPFGYLVPDEAMLPPESIRFFRVDTAWAEALVDGAFSIGRNLTADADAASLMIDQAVQPAVLASARAAAPRRATLTAAASGANGSAGSGAAGSTGSADPGQPVVWSGFLLRSRVVTQYPGLGVNAFPAGATGDDPDAMLGIVRFDRLGPGSDTLICIVDGDAEFFDLHEPPEHLHFGVDSYTAPQTAGAAPVVLKGLRQITTDAGGTIALGPPVQQDVSAAFRTSSPRVMNVKAMAGLVGAHSGLASADAAQMGFEMTQGAGKVRFTRATT